VKPPSFPIDVGGARTTAILYAAALAEGGGGRPVATLATLALAHGAGAPQTHPWMVGMARALAGRGLDVVTFNFLYADARRRAPDKNEVLEATWRAVLRALADGPSPLRARARLFIGGKSMGGRIATQVAAGAAAPADSAPKGAIGAGPAGEAPIAGVVLFGYPLHPPGKPDVLRVAHLPRVSVPLLFVQGSRDAFGSPAELSPHLRGLALGTRLFVVEGGDHSLAVRKGAGAAEISARVADEVVRFVSAVSA